MNLLPAGPWGPDGCRVPLFLSGDGTLVPFVVWRSSTDVALWQLMSEGSPPEPYASGILGVGGWEILNLGPEGLGP